MPRTLRFVGVLLVWTAAAFALYRLCVLPAQCNREEPQIQAVTLNLLGASSNPTQIAVFARQNLRRLQRCLDDCPTTNRFMLAAANERLLGRYDEAIGRYRQAMELDQRPELYVNLGLTQIQSGRVDIGVRNLVIGCTFNPILLDDVSVYHDEVQQQVSAYQSRIRQLEKQRR